MLSMLPESPQIPTHFACRSSCHSASITCGFAPSCAKLDTALTAQCPEVVRHMRGFRHRRLADAHGPLVVRSAGVYARASPRALGGCGAYLCPYRPQGRAHGARWEKACTDVHAPLPSRRSPERRLDLHTAPHVHGDVRRRSCCG